MVAEADLLVLSQVPNIGANRLRALVNHFRGSQEIFRASSRDIARVDGFSEKLASMTVHYLRGPRIAEARRQADRQISRLKNIGGALISFWDGRYPDPLRKIYDPPPYLFVRGEYGEADRYAIAIVGTRSPSEYGMSLAGRFSRDLAAIGITIVSGLARGIDTIAHSAALSCGGRTLAAIGSGLDVVYPPENRTLFGRIPGSGAIFSEYEMGAKPDAVNFPRRNRIISGLTLGTLIVETDLNGGAMITASTALDQNREVFAIPGNVNSRRCRGCHALIKEGRAKLVEDVEDILVELSEKLGHLVRTPVRADTRSEGEMSLFERSIYDLLDAGPLHVDEIAGRSGLSASDSLVNLLSLEIKGLVKQLPGKLFVRA